MANYEIPAVNIYPEKGNTHYEIDPMNMRKQYYIGLWQGTVTLKDGTVRTYKSYCSKNAKRDARHCFLAVPSGVDSAEFIVRSGWVEVAEKDNAVLSIFEPKNGKWGTPEEEAEYFKLVYGGLRYYTPWGSFDWRWCGYGEGGAAMQRHIMQDPIYAAAAVIIDGSECFTKEALDAIAATQLKSRKMTYNETCGETPVPMWLISKNVSESTKQVLSYWQKANDCLPRETKLSDGSVEYHQNPYSNAVETYDQKVGMVRLTEKDCGDYSDPALAAAAYDFITQFSRNGADSPYSNALTAAAPAGTPFIYHEEVVGGYLRDWYVFTPPGFDAEKESLPMVIYFHGTHQSGLVSSRQADWWKVAQKNRFIAVLPSATLEQVRMPGKVPGMSWNCENYGNADDIAFVRYLVDFMKEHYHVDPSRIYANGQSNGGRMTLYCAFALPEIFAAVASMGASTLGESYDSKEKYILPPDVNEAFPIPVMSSMGEADMFNYNLSDPESTSSLRCGYFCKRYGMDFVEDRYHYERGRYINDIWFNDKRVPMLRQTVIKKRAHNFQPMENEMTWDEWFSLFARDPETKKIIYMGKVID